MHKKLLLCVTLIALSSTITIAIEKPFSTSVNNCIKTVSLAGAIGGIAGGIVSSKSGTAKLGNIVVSAAIGTALGGVIAAITPTMSTNMLPKDFIPNKLEEPQSATIIEKAHLDGMRIGMCAITASVLACGIVTYSASSK